MQIKFLDGRTEEFDSLCGANLRGANLRGADLREAYLCWAILCDANLDGARISYRGKTVMVFYLVSESKREGVPY